MAKQAVKQISTTKSINPMLPDTMGRREMIAYEAWLRAEQRGFEDGDPVADWLEAEAEIDRLLNSNM